MNTHGVAIQHTLIFTNEEPEQFSKAVDEYALLRGLSKAEAKSELMRLGMSLLMANIYNNVKAISPKAAVLAEATVLAEAMSGTVTMSVTHILRDILPAYGEFFARLLESPDTEHEGGPVITTPAGDAVMDVPQPKAAYHSGVSGVDVTVIRGGTREDTRHG